MDERHDFEDHIHTDMRVVEKHGFSSFSILHIQKNFFAYFVSD